MIRLSFHDALGKLVTQMRMTDLRVIGGVICNSFENGLIAHYTGGNWKHRRASPRVKSW